MQTKKRKKIRLEMSIWTILNKKRKQFFFKRSVRMRSRGPGKQTREAPAEYLFYDLFLDALLFAHRIN